MPVDNSGVCNTYSNARWLSDDQIATIAAWGRRWPRQGDPRKGPLVPDPEPGLDALDLTLDPEYSPIGDGADDYRCFVLPAPLAETRHDPLRLRHEQPQRGRDLGRRHERRDVPYVTRH
jgi:hypothetical protein